MPMIKFVEFTSEKAALLFTNYSKSLGFDVVITKQGQVVALTAPEAELPQILPLLEQFLQQPDHPRYQAAAWQQSQSINFSNSWPTFSLASLLKAPLTTLVVFATLLVYLWQQVDFSAANAALQLTNLAQPWRWVTPMLLHFSLMHLVFNLCWWVLLANKIEQLRNSGMLFQLLLSSAVLSNGLQLLLVGPNFGGLSGVVYALLGYCWLHDKLQRKQFYPVNDGLAVFMLFWLILGFMDVLWINMANWAHLGGLLCGLGWALLSKRSE